MLYELPGQAKHEGLPATNQPTYLPVLVMQTDSTYVLLRTARLVMLYHKVYEKEHVSDRQVASAAPSGGALRRHV